MAFKIENVSKTFISKGNVEVLALDNINLEIESGKFVCFVGPSGCGKTTLLRLMEGFENPTQGQIYDDDELVLNPSRERGFIFQDYSLFPWLNVIDNVTFGLKIAGKDEEESKERALTYLDAVGLKEFADKYPHELSGGMKQRVAIIRSVINDSKSLLMDEPFSALDVQTRHLLQKQFISNWASRQRTTIFVTHDVDEAVFLADEIVIFSKRPGRIKKVFTNTLERPRDRDSVEFRNMVVEITKHIDQTDD